MSGCGSDDRNTFLVFIVIVQAELDETTKLEIYSKRDVFLVAVCRDNSAAKVLKMKTFAR